jgi:transcriptional regulator with XRE-family HTH domain
MTFGEWLWRQIREHRISQTQLARKAGLHHSAVSRLVRDEQVPSLATVQALCSALRVPYTVHP